MNLSFRLLSGLNTSNKNKLVQMTNIMMNVRKKTRMKVIRGETKQASSIFQKKEHDISDPDYSKTRVLAK